MNIKFPAVADRLQQFNLRKLTKIILYVAVIIGLVTAYFWYSQVYMTPERRFWMAVNNSMATPSVVRTLTEGGSGNQVTQDYRFNFAPQRVIENKVNFIERSATTNTEIETQGIITPEEQFLRYTKYTSDNGTDLNDLLGVWASQSASDEELEQARLNFLSEHVTLAIFGNFNAKYRQNLVQTFKDRTVYKIDFSAALNQQVDGEDVFVYPVSVNLKEYAGLLKQAFIDAGLGDFPPLDPEQYRDGAEVQAQFVVRKKDNAFVGISFGGRQENYSNYGVDKNVELPQTEITIPELQQRVQEELS